MREIMKIVEDAESKYIDGVVTPHGTRFNIASLDLDDYKVRTLNHNNYTNVIISSKDGRKSIAYGSVERIGNDELSVHGWIDDPSFRRKGFSVMFIKFAQQVAAEENRTIIKPSVMSPAGEQFWKGRNYMRGSRPRLETRDDSPIVVGMVNTHMRMREIMTVVAEGMDDQSSTGPVKLYHLTNKANFKLNPNFAPEDNTFAMQDRSGIKGIYLTPNVERWVNGHNYVRAFVAEIYADPSVRDDDRVGRWGGEVFVPADQFGKLKVNRVVPLDVIAREEYGEHGWIERSHGHEFDTGNEIPDRVGNQGPFPDYKYDKDVRNMSPEEVKRIKQHFTVGRKAREKYRG